MIKIYLKDIINIFIYIYKIKMYCNQCKKMLEQENFELKKDNVTYYTRCITCRSKFNKYQKNKYAKTCSRQTLCNNIDCKDCYNKSFASYEGKTENGKLKIECWHEDNELKPREVFKSSGKKYKFNCDICNHDFCSCLNDISGRNRWCPYCSNKKLCNKEDCIHCYNKSFASYEGKTKNGKLKIECWQEENKLKPRDVFKSSGKKYKFNCDVCNHDFCSSLCKVYGENSWCIYCSNQKLCNKEDCNHCYNNSFASYQEKTSNDKLKIECWHEENKLKPRDVFKSSSKKYKFNCDVCNHDFYSSLCNVSRLNNWCPYCSNQKLCNKEDCNYCYNNSFASYQEKTSNDKLKIECWHEENKLKPRQVFKKSNKKYKFNCDKCNHDFYSCLNMISGRNIWCHYCSNKKICNKEDCIHCYNNSFASYEGKTLNNKLKIECWHEENKLKPRDVFKKTNKKFKFNCDICNHNFYSCLNMISGQNTWCPICKNKTEKKLYNWLLEKEFIKEVKKEYKPIWCSTIYKTIIKNKMKEKRYQYSYDFLITFNNKKKVIIELDGEQHFKQVSNWKSPLHNQIRDKYKEIKAKQNGLKIIRCIQEDVFMERNNWNEKLMKKLLKYL